MYGTVKHYYFPKMHSFHITFLAELVLNVYMYNSTILFLK